jgi:hypothetical protein
MATTPVPAAEPTTVVGRKDMYKAFAASLTGTALEFYDFAVYSAGWCPGETGGHPVVVVPDQLRQAVPRELAQGHRRPGLHRLDRPR